MAACLLAGATVAAATAMLAPSSAGAASNGDKPVVLTEEQLKAALLVLDDLSSESGMMDIPGESIVPAPKQTGGVCDGPDNLAHAERAHVAAEQVVQFFNPNTDGPYVAELALAFPTDADAKQFMRLARTQIEKCKSGWSQVIDLPEDPPAKLSVKLRPMKAIGDERFSSRQTAIGGADDITRDPDLPRLYDNAIVRRGNYALVISRGGISNVIGNGRPQLEAAATTAVQNLDAAIKSAGKSS
jgi:hypothetical protein